MIKMKLCVFLYLKNEKFWKTRNKMENSAKKYIFYFLFSIFQKKKKIFFFQSLNRSIIFQSYQNAPFLKPYSIHNKYISVCVREKDYMRMNVRVTNENKSLLSILYDLI